jgi:hypothetical protein
MFVKTEQYIQQIEIADLHNCDHLIEVIQMIRILLLSFTYSRLSATMMIQVCLRFHSFLIAICAISDSASKSEYCLSTQNNVNEDT